MGFTTVVASSPSSVTTAISTGRGRYLSPTLPTVSAARYTSPRASEGSAEAARKRRTRTSDFRSRGSTSRRSTSPSRLVQRESATYSWPLAKVPPVRSTTTRSRVWPWDLWMVIAQASFIGSWVKVPITWWTSSPPRASGRVMSQVCSRTCSSRPSRSCTWTTGPSASWPIAVTRPRVPLTQRSRGSLLSIITCAPTARPSWVSVGRSKPSSSPLICAVKVCGGPGRRSSIWRLREVTMRLVVASVNQNSSIGGSKSRSVRALSSARASSSSVPSRTAFNRCTRRSSPIWRNTVDSSTTSKSSRVNERAEKKNGVP